MVSNKAFTRPGLVFQRDTAHSFWVPECAVLTRIFGSKIRDQLVAKMLCPNAVLLGWAV